MRRHQALNREDTVSQAFFMDKNEFCLFSHRSVCFLDSGLFNLVFEYCFYTKYMLKKRSISIATIDNVNINI